MRDDRGAGSVYVLIAGALLAGLGWAAAAVGEAVLVRHRAAAAADLASLAAAATAVEGGDACGAARRTAAANAADVVSCAVDAAGNATVVVRISPPALLRRVGVPTEVIARARAGPA